MIIDENEFFRQASIRICGSLDIQKAMVSCTQYIKQYIPISTMEISLYDRQNKAIRVIAKYPEDGIDLVKSTSFLSKDASDLIDKEHDEGLNIKISNQPEKDPIIRSHHKISKKDNVSAIVLMLIIEGENLGALTLIADKKNAYHKQHSKLLYLLTEPFSIAVSNALRYSEILELNEIVAAENRELTQEARNNLIEDVIGSESGLKEVMEKVRKVGPLGSPVMLLGETGVGKEVIANAIHNSSPQKDSPFIKINCGAIPDNLIDSELFGHEKGAFTGATSSKRGRFERANGGTIFLDEIGELLPQTQVRLLRVIQNKEIERVGGSGPIPIDARIISATNRNLKEMVDKGDFREDLWYRVNIFPISIPPLRERTEDIPALTRYIVNRKSINFKIRPIPSIDSDTLELLKEYSWPGNVRELENIIERALILNQGQHQSSKLVFENFASQIPVSQKPVSLDDNEELLMLDEAIKRHIQQALRRTRGKVFGEFGAAKLLGLNPNTLRSRMRKLGLLSNEHNEGAK
jgi:transcriptional regulator with GAF, ATPase, and Fis domain